MYFARLSDISSCFHLAREWERPTDLKWLASRAGRQQHDHLKDGDETKLMPRTFFKKGPGQEIGCVKEPGVHICLIPAWPTNRRHNPPRYQISELSASVKTREIVSKCQLHQSQVVTLRGRRVNQSRLILDSPENWIK